MNDDENKKYTVKFDGEEISYNERFKGTIEIELSVSDKNIHKLTIE